MALKKTTTKKEVLEKSTYNKKKEKDWFNWKADCLISSYQRRHKKNDTPYTYLSSRKEYAEILKTKFGSCCYCGIKHTEKNFSADHDIPVSLGGNTSDDNLVYCCTKCNSAKGSMTGAEFTSLLKLISSWEDKGKYILSKLRAATTIFRGPR